MKKIILILSFVALSINAQNKNTKKADKLYSRLEYVKAAKAYQKLEKKGKADDYVYKQLGECFYNIFNPEQASNYYAKAIASEQDTEIYYNYAQMLKAQAKYEEASKQMQKFASKSPNDQRTIEYKKDPNYVTKLLNQAKRFEVEKSQINSESPDFGALLNGKEVYFASGRGTGKKYGWNNQSYNDVYKAFLNEDGTVTAPMPVAELNSKYHDGPVSVTHDGKTMYFASESFKEKMFKKDKKMNNKMGQVALFKAMKNGDKWENIESLPFNNKEYSVGSPSISKDGKTLYFASNMPGGKGGVDIWKVSVNGGSYGKPENLGDQVNTPADENFPFITDDHKTLYFSSKGKPGLGGYDVFALDLAKNSISNIGQPVNTKSDDFAFTFNQDKNIGFLSSNRENDTDHIYLLKPICGVDAMIAVKDAKTNSPIAQAKVVILDDKKNIVGTEMTDVNGMVSSNLLCNKDYSVQVSKNDYNSGVFTIAKSNGPKAEITAALQPIEVIIKPDEVVLNEIYFEYNKSNITQEGAFELDKLVGVMNKYPEMIILVESHTDNRGADDYNQKLSDKRAKSTVQYVISKGINAARITGEGKGETTPIVNCGENCTEEEHAKNRRSKFNIVKK
jgi:outer membrane protein OmpA-like peptidoglycan-associated protein/tetratricopeptide (TPR) repeat protein